jgi:hypothetical protein
MLLLLEYGVLPSVPTGWAHPTARVVAHRVKTRKENDVVTNWLDTVVEECHGAAVNRAELWTTFQAARIKPARMLTKEFFVILCDFFGCQPAQQHVIGSKVGWLGYRLVQDP